MVEFNLPHLWLAKGKYPYYRRNGLLLPIMTAEGERLFLDDWRFFDAFQALHASFKVDKPATVREFGTIEHLIVEYLNDPEFEELSKTTQRLYRMYLDQLRREIGHLRLATMPREAVLKLRNDRRNTPSSANAFVSVVRTICNYAKFRRTKFRLPLGWENPAVGIKRLREGQGHVPWEEHQIEQFCDHWPILTLERTAFEGYLGTGQRGGDIACMRRSQYRRSGDFFAEIDFTQMKTAARIWLPASYDLMAAFDPWLASHDSEYIFPAASGHLPINRLRDRMREAITKAGLPLTCTLHGLRYTFACRAVELGLDHQTIESIVGHETLEMAKKYTEKRRAARLVVDTLERGVAAWRAGRSRRRGDENS